MQQHGAEFPQIAGNLQNQSEKSANYQGTSAQFGVTPLSQFSQNTAQITGQWTLYNGSLNQVLAQEDRRQVESARSDLLRNEDEVAADVAAAFYDLAVKRQTVTLDVANLAYQRDLVEAARANERVGKEAGVDVLRAEVAATRAEASLVTARADDANSSEALASRIGAPLDVGFAIRRLSEAARAASAGRPPDRHRAHRPPRRRGRAGHAASRDPLERGHRHRPSSASRRQRRLRQPVLRVAAGQRTTERRRRERGRHHAVPAAQAHRAAGRPHPAAHAAAAGPAREPRFLADRRDGVVDGPDHRLREKRHAQHRAAAAQIASASGATWPTCAARSNSTSGNRCATWTRTRRTSASPSKAPN